MMYEPSNSVVARRDAPAAHDPSLMPMLAVMLLLLAFFIMLVSMVEFDAGRTKDVLDSVSATFAANPGDAASGSDGGGESAEAAIRRVSSEFGVALATLLRDRTYSIETSGARAIIRIDNSELFASGVTPAPTLDMLAARLAALVGGPSPRVHYEIEAVEPFGELGATRRAGVVVRALESAGIAPGSLMTALATSEPRQTRIEIGATRVTSGDAASGSLP